VDFGYTIGMTPRFSLWKYLLMVAATLASAQARCGETLEEVKARYGEPIAILDKKFCEESDNGTYVFLVKVKKNGGTKQLNVPGFDVRVVVEFKNNKAWLIRYTSFKVQISDTLAAGEWTDIVPPNASIDQSNPSQVTYTLPSGSTKKFCRLSVTP
jgi:hypothetical protein